MFMMSIFNPSILEVWDGSAQKKHYGYNQAWYGTDWQRRAGCGPTVASTIVFYLKRTQLLLELGQNICKMQSREKSLQLMEEVWEYVTPTMDGIPSTKRFSDSLLKYMREKGMEVEYACCDLSKHELDFPKLSAVLNFLKVALLKDAPIAFLNLCNGDEKNLVSWHWVIIISLEYDEVSKSVLLNILDEGVIKPIDLTLWYNTTTLGGGFAYFSNANN